MHPNLRPLKQALFAWLSQHQGNGVAASLTFKPRLDGRRLTPQDAENAMSHYLHRLDRKVYGRHSSRQVGAIPIREGGVQPWEKHLHYHLVLPAPPNYSVHDWKVTAAQTWPILDWASKTQNHFVIISDDGWLSYMLKLRDKPDYLDSLDIANLRLT